MFVTAVLEYNAAGCLLYAEHFPGAFARGAKPAEALAKLPEEIGRYLCWRDGAFCAQPVEVRVVQSKQSVLQLHDADTDILFESEKGPLPEAEYRRLKALVLRSARDFQTLFDAIPEPRVPLLARRETFYGALPVTAEEMYRHTNEAAGYYVGEIGAERDCLDRIEPNRLRAFSAIEACPDFLRNRTFAGSYGEAWTLRKVLRRFLWHDRIHARAMLRAARRRWDGAALCDQFCFGAGADPII